jgi:DNA primase
MVYDTRIVAEDLSIDKIRSYTDDRTIYETYLHQPIKINRPISSPFREDKTPSFGFFITREGNIMFKDFSTGESGDVVKFVKQFYNLTYHKALEQIWKDVVAKTNKNLKKVEKNGATVARKKAVIGVKRKYFTKTDDEYWSQFGITRDILKEYNVTPIEAFWVNELPQAFIYSKTCPMYAYQIFDKFKIYRPYSKTKKDKWRSNCGMYDIQGFQQLPDKGDLLIITKSLKDVMTLRANGYNSVSPQSEHSLIPQVIIDNLKSRFKNIIVFYDYDNGGVEGAKKMSDKYDIKSIFIEKHYLDIYGIKDISDFRKEMGEKQTSELLKQLFKDGKKIHKK